MKFIDWKIVHKHTMFWNEFWTIKNMRFIQDGSYCAFVFQIMPPNDFFFWSIPKKLPPWLINFWRTVLYSHHMHVYKYTCIWIEFKWIGNIICQMRKNTKQQQQERKKNNFTAKKDDCDRQMKIESHTIAFYWVGNNSKW